ncbi:MAG: hemolysin family protein [[Clostridium] leptum]
MDDWFSYILLVILIALSAFFSASETAYTTVNKIRLQNYVDAGSKKAKTALFIAENYDRTLTTILIGNNIVNIGASSIATLLFVKLFGPSGAAISTAVMTILILIFGEVLPKSFAKESSEKFALAFSRSLRILMTVFWPVVFLFIQLKKVAKHISPIKEEETPTVTEQELKFIVESIEDEGVLEKQESELVQHALEFDEKTVQEVLTPRVDMTTLDIEDDLQTNIGLVLTERFSRIPVCRGTSDRIIGILHTKDLLEALVRGDAIDLASMVQPAFFVYKTKKLSSLLADFKRNKTHVAIVTDDYGGTVGMVTMEDLLEELVGDIWDEDEEIIRDFVRIDSQHFLISGDLTIRELFDHLDLPFSNLESNHTSCGGWALEALGHIPQAGEAFRFKNMTLTIQEMDDQRVKKLSVYLAPQPEEEEKSRQESNQQE